MITIVALVCHIANADTPEACFERVVGKVDSMVTVMIACELPMPVRGNGRPNRSMPGRSGASRKSCADLATISRRIQSEMKKSDRIGK